MGFIKPESVFFARVVQSGVNMGKVKPENPGPPKILESEKIKPINFNKYYIPVNGFYLFFCRLTSIER